MKLPRTNVWTLVLLCALNFATLAPPLTAAYEAPPATVAAATVIDQSIADGAPDDRVRLIVALRTPFAPDAALNDSQRAAQRQSLAQSQRAVGQMASALGGSVTASFSSIPFLAIELPRGGVAVLGKRGDVARVDLDRLAEPLLDQSVPLIGADAAWAAGFDGTGQTVAVLDTGASAAHPFLQAAVVDGACFSQGGSDYTSLCPGGASAQYGIAAGDDCRSASGCGHGTHVAGIIAGRAPGIDFAGVARGASLLPVVIYHRRESGCSGSSPCVMSWTSDQLRALEWVYTTARFVRPIAAVNLSLGSGRYSAQQTCDEQNGALKAAVDNLRGVGIVTIAAAGNSGYPDALTAPACISSVVSVGASNSSLRYGPIDSVASFSNGAPFLGLLAPGVSIRSSVAGGGYDTKSGTSMAAPHVAGAWAVARSAAPTASVELILATLRRTGVPVTDQRSGQTTPRIQLDAATRALRLSIAPPVTQPTIDAISARSVPDDIPYPLTIDGALLGGTVAAALRGEGRTIALEAVYALDQRRVRAVVPRGASPGSYRVELTADDGLTILAPEPILVFAAASAQDLRLAPDALWSATPNARVGVPIDLGVTVERQGGTRPLIARVSFTLQSPAGGALGSSAVRIDAGHGSAASAALRWTPPTAGKYIVSATVDADRAVDEVDEDNNTVTRTFTVLPTLPDSDPPRVDALTVSVEQGTALATIAANDGAIGSGVASLYWVEYEHAPHIGGWLPVASSAGWIPYRRELTIAPQPLPGVHALQLWVADAAGNIALAPGEARFNIAGDPSLIARGQVQSYIASQRAGQPLRVALDVAEGELSAAIWGSGQLLASASLSAGERADLVAGASEDGQLIVEVYGRAAARYRVELGAAERAGATAPPAAAQALTMALTGDGPDRRLAIPAAPVIASGFRLFAPLVGS